MIITALGVVGGIETASPDAPTPTAVCDLDPEEDQ